MKGTIAKDQVEAEQRYYEEEQDKINRTKKEIEKLRLQFGD